MARKNWKKPISITLSPEIFKLLKELADEQRISRSMVVENAIIAASRQWLVLQRCRRSDGKILP